VKCCLWVGERREGSGGREVIGTVCNRKICRVRPCNREYKWFILQQENTLKLIFDITVVIWLA